MTYDEALDKAKRAFNRREFEQFIQPIIQTLSAKYELERANFIRDKINSISESVKVRLRNYKEVLVDGKEVVPLSVVKDIFDSEKSKEI